MQEITELIKPDRKAVDKARADLKPEEVITSPKRCYR